MSQGKKYTEEEKHKIIYEDLQKYFLLGQSLRRACINGQIPYTTFKEWYDNDESLRIIVNSWRHYPLMKAEEVIINSFNVTPEEVKAGVKPNYDNAKWYAERKGKDEGYSIRTELTGKDGDPIKTIDLTKLSDEELAKLNDIAGKATVDPSGDIS